MKRLTQLWSALQGGDHDSSPFTRYQVLRVLKNFADAAKSGDISAVRQWLSDDVYHWGMASGRIHRTQAELMLALREDTVAGEDFAQDIEPQLLSVRSLSRDVVVADILMVYTNHTDKAGRQYAEFKEPTVVLFARRQREWKIASVYAAGNMAGSYGVS